MSLSRRDFLTRSAVATGGLAALSWLPQQLPTASAADTAPAAPRKKLAVITTVYRLNSHADHIVGRFLKGYIRNGAYHRPNYDVVSMYVDQIGDDDLSAGLSQKYGFQMCRTVRDALILDQDQLAVDAVLLVGEHGNYPSNELGQKLYPRHELFSQIVTEFRRSGRSVPVFNDKHLSYSWAKAKEMVDWSRELKFPLQAGSSLPVTWRLPELNLPVGTRFDSALVVAFSDPDIYGFHALETLQCHVERRAGGERGVRSVQALTGPAVWEAGDKGVWSRELLEAALGRSHTLNIGELRDNVSQPLAYLVEYRDGFRGTVLMLNGHVEDFTFAARLQGEKAPVATLHILPGRPAVKYFDALTWNIERMYDQGRAVIPIERTLLVSGTLEALLQSRHQKSRIIETPHLDVVYSPPEDDGHFRGPIDRTGQQQQRQD